MYAAGCGSTGSRFNGYLDVNYSISGTEIAYTTRGSITTKIE
jgi:hypothetical protein